jgi:hypothetical protein
MAPGSVTRVLLVAPTLALLPLVAGAEPAFLPPPAGVVPIFEVPPTTPPSPTIPAGPQILHPVAPPAAARPVKLIDIQPFVTASEDYTDNFHRTPSAAEENLRSALSPGLEGRLDHGRLTGQARYALSLFHDSAPDEVGLFNELSGRLAWQATPRIELTLAGAFTESDEPDRADRLGLRRGRREFTVTTASLAPTYTGPLLAISPYYRLSRFAEDEGEETLSHVAGATASVEIGRIHRGTLGYEYLASETERGNSLAAGGESSIRGHEVTASVSRELTARTVAGLSGSYAIRAQDRVDRDTDFSRWTLSLFSTYAIPQKVALTSSLGVSYIDADRGDDGPLLSTQTRLSYWFARAVAILGVERGYSETFTETQNSGVVETSAASLSLSYPFTPGLAAAARVGYRETRTTDILDQGAERTEETLTAGLALSFELLRWLKFSLDYTFTDTSSTEALRTFTENRARLLFTASF